MDYILTSFPIKDGEYAKLSEMFDSLALYAAWQLVKKNVKNNHTDDPEDIAQELRWAIVRAGSYYKRQVFLEDCMSVAKNFVNDKETADILNELEMMWKMRTHHGANKQRFGEKQERELEKLVNRIVPKKQRPRKDQPLNITTKFITYCKAITWNHQRALGKKITREKSIRANSVSLSEHGHLMGVEF